MRKDIDVIDLFDEENKKKEKKLNRKMERARRKEEKLQKKLNKKLEKQENDDFDKYLEKVKEEKVIEEPIKIENTNPIDSLQINEINYIDEELVEAPVKPKSENINYEENIFKQIDSNIGLIDNSFKERENIIEELLDKKEDKPDEFVEKKTKKHPFLNVLVSILSVVLFVISVDYLVYNLLINFNNLDAIINTILLVIMSIMYLFSIVIKRSKSKKIFEILSLIFMILFMSYHLFII